MTCRGGARECGSMRAIGEAAMDTMFRQAGLPSGVRARLLRHARDTVRLARARWPQILDDAPPAVRSTVLARLDGGTALSAASG